MSVWTRYCPACEGDDVEIVSRDERNPAQLPDACCHECGWNGYADELVSDQDYKDAAGEREYDRRANEGVCV